MPSQLLNGRQTFLDQNGHPLSGGSCALYIAGTGVPLRSFQDEAGTVLNLNPIPLDAAGRCTIYGVSGSYRQVTADALGDIQWDTTTYTAGDPQDLFAGTVGGDGYTYVVGALPDFIGAVGQKIGFFSGVANVGTPCFLNVNGTSYRIVKDLSAPANLAVGDIGLGTFYQLVFDGQLFHTTTALSLNGIIAAYQAADAVVYANAQNYANAVALQAQNQAEQIALNNAVAYANATFVTDIRLGARGVQSADQGDAPNTGVLVGAYNNSSNGIYEIYRAVQKMIAGNWVAIAGNA